MTQLLRHSMIIMKLCISTLQLFVTKMTTEITIWSLGWWRKMRCHSHGLYPHWFPLLPYFLVWARLLVWVWHGNEGRKEKSCVWWRWLEMKLHAIITTCVFPYSIFWFWFSGSNLYVTMRFRFSVCIFWRKVMSAVFGDAGDTHIEETM